MNTKHGKVYYSDDDERRRLQELYSLNILFTKPEKSFDRITQMVSSIFDMPVALISLITPDKQWFKSQVGLTGELLEKRSTEREASFCQHAIAHKEPLIVRDSLFDPRFVQNRLVEGEPHIRFYAGAPLRTRNDNVLGTLCVLDFRPRDFEDKDMELLQQFADIVIDEIEYREEIRRRVSAEERLRVSEERYKNIVELSPDIILVYQNHEFVYANPASVHMFHLHGTSPPYDTERLLHCVEAGHRDETLAFILQYSEQETAAALHKEIVLTKDESKLDYMVTLSKITFNSRDAVMVIGRDISVQKKAERMMLEMNQKLKEISRRDGLTDIPNRRSMDEFLETEWRRAMRTSSPISVILIDIDFFKLYNDTYGHLAGDRCLIDVARCIEQTVSRSSDFVSRYGGEEFAVILPQTEASGALHLAEIIRGNVETLQIPHESSEIGDVVTISLGIYTVIPTKGMMVEGALFCADQALYKAKQLGRNCISMYE